MEDKEPEVMVPPSTWAEDFKKILDRTYFTDLQFNVKVIPKVDETLMAFRISTVHQLWSQSTEASSTARPRFLP